MMSSHQPPARARLVRAAVRLALLAALFPVHAALADGALPSGGQIVAGQASLSESANALTIHQSSESMIANWQSFSIGAGNSVKFEQPGASSVALNRVVGQDPSVILGSLQANGRVFLVNPRGVVIGNGARVQTGGFVASTLGIEDADFLAGRYRFTGTGAAVVNQGDIAGNVVALIAPSVTNEGTITGNTALAAGTDVLLDFAGDGLLSVEVPASTVATLIDNKGIIRADGGVAILTAKGASDALKSVVNNTGTIQAQTLANKGGRILLLSDMQNGETREAGTLDASAPQGGNGGFIETSAQSVNVAPGTRITTHAPTGTDGTWLVDPGEYTIAPSGGNISGADLLSILALGHVVIDTTGWQAPGASGNIFINDALQWSSHSLTLTAERNIILNAPLEASGTAALFLKYGQDTPAAGNTASFVRNASMKLASSVNFQTQLGSDGAPITWTVITALGTPTSSGDGTLQGIAGDMTGHYVLGDDIDASATFGWNAGAGFTPLGLGTAAFSGTLDGLGHQILGLQIVRPSTDAVGLFSAVHNGGVVRDLSLYGSLIRGHDMVGSIAGVLDFGGTFSKVGGYDVVGANDVGGIAGQNFGTISDSYGLGDVTTDLASTTGRSGGLVGFNSPTATIARSYVTGDVLGYKVFGGLVGRNEGTVSDSHATGQVIGPASVSDPNSGLSAGGLAGFNNGVVIRSYATGNVKGTQYVGGLVAVNDNQITDSYATGKVDGVIYVGGLVGYAFTDSLIRNVFATGDVTGTNQVGGLIGRNESNLGDSVRYAYARGSVTGTADVGGAVGLSYDSELLSVYSTGLVTGTSNTGGLVGQMFSGRIIRGAYDGDSSGQNAACGIGTCSTVVRLSTAEMKDPFSFIDRGWDFASIWGASRTGENDGYMVLRSLSTTEYDYYVRLSDASLTRTYGDATSSLSAVTLDGVGAGNVTLNWGSAITSATHAGRYSLGAASVLNPTFTTGSAPDYYFDYGNGQVDIGKAALTATAGSLSRTYDGQAFTGNNGISFSGFVNGDNAGVLGGALTYGGSAQGAKNAGTYALTASGLTSGDYAISYRDGTLTITPRVISLSGQRVYDGSTAVASSSLTLENLVSGETLALSGTGALNDKNVANGKSLALGTLALADGTGLAANYTLVSGAHTVDVTPKTIDAITGITAANKTYDGNAVATLNTSGATFVGRLAGDDLSVAAATGRFAQAEPAAGQTVLISDLMLGGADAGNYQLASTTATTTAGITPAGSNTQPPSSTAVPPPPLPPQQPDRTPDGTDLTTVTPTTQQTLRRDSVPIEICAQSEAGTQRRESCVPLAEP